MSRACNNCKKEQVCFITRNFIEANQKSQFQFYLTYDVLGKFVAEHCYYFEENDNK